MTQSLIDTLQLKNKGIISLIGAGGKTSLMFQLAKQLSKSKKILTTTTTKIFMPETFLSPAAIIEDDVDELMKKARQLSDKFTHLNSLCS